MEQTTKAINIGNLKLGSDQPERIIVPIIASSFSDVLKQANQIINSTVNIVEWRLDYLQSNLTDFDNLVRTAIDLKSIIGDIPLIATNRTSNEGGTFDYPGNIYVDSYNQLIQAEVVDAIDVEFSRNDLESAQLRSLAVNGDVTLIMSHHDFENTSDKNELIFLISQMAKENPDIIEVVTIADQREDAMNLMNATLAADHQIKQPIIAMATGNSGKITQFAGKTFGSIATMTTIDDTALTSNQIDNILKLI